MFAAFVLVVAAAAAALVLAVASACCAAASAAAAAARHACCVCVSFFFVIHNADASSTDIDPHASGRSPQTSELLRLAPLSPGACRGGRVPSARPCARHPGRHCPSLANAHCFWEASDYKKTVH